MSSPENATAEQYDACRPSRSMVQQRVTGNLFVTFSSNVASTQSQTIQGQYQVTPKIAVSTTRDQNGGFALDTIIKKSW
jgi:translocation and assembly module TamB